MNLLSFVCQNSHQYTTLFQGVFQLHVLKSRDMQRVINPGTFLQSADTFASRTVIFEGYVFFMKFNSFHHFILAFSRFTIYTSKKKSFFAENLFSLIFFIFSISFQFFLSRYFSSHIRVSLSLFLPLFYYFILFCLLGTFYLFFL